MRRVLLVEDDDAVRGILELVLQRAGWEVEPLASVDEAERRFQERPTDVVLSDLVMPGKGAFDLLFSLRERDPRLAFVVMSGYLTDEKFREALQAGASDCLTKPCDEETLERALSRAVLLRHSIGPECAPASPEGERTELVVPADLGRRAEMLSQVDVAAQAGGFDLRRNRILLALDEAFTNAVKHGAQGDDGLTITVRASFSVHGGVVTVSDPGPGFDPVMADYENDRAMSRRGMYLIRAACDDVRWIGRGNVCQMVFRQPPEEEILAAERVKHARAERRRSRRVAGGSDASSVRLALRRSEGKLP